MPIALDTPHPGGLNLNSIVELTTKNAKKDSYEWIS
jgi:hypothetical protein